MRFNRLHGAILAVLMLMVGSFVLVNLAPVAHAQSATSGGISGEVKDPTGALVPNAKVTIVNVATNATRVITTNSLGRYTASELNTGVYKVSAVAQNLQSNATSVEVLVGTTVTADINVTPKGDVTKVEVSATNLPLVDTQNVAIATTFNESQIEDLPTPGGDVTTVAFTAPGVVVNVGGSYGNFSANGIPGISNLFVLNGFDNQDPFLNLNNSGSSNLTLGQGELAEATVVENGYNSQYGRAAGALLYYNTKSGGNQFHGEADYNWNGSMLNANGWFNQFDESLSKQPLSRPHAVSNEWAVNAGGPIIKDKVFFFADYEGLRYVLPGSSGFLTFPTTQLQTWMTENVAPVSATTYGQVIAAFQKSPAYATAIPVTNGSAPNQDGTGNLGCGDLAGTLAPGGGTFGVDTPCMNVGSASANNINIEWLNTDRIDWQVNDKHRIFGRFKVDHGSQPTYTSFIDPLFSAVSIQPEYEGQFDDSYAFNPNTTNVFVAAANWYSAYFGPTNTPASYAELPINFFYSDFGLDGSGVNSAPGLPELGVPFYLTQGRNVTQYQFEDDFTWIHGKHTFKTGVNFRRDDVEDYDQRINTVFPYTVILDLGDFASGSLNNYFPTGYNSFNQAYSNALTARLALYNVGFYGQDEWQLNSKFKLTYGIRIDRTGNPLCNGNCFSSYVGSFPNGGASTSQPYNFANGGSIRAANAHPFPSVEIFNFQPRVGFNYSVDDKTEIRGGIGLFSDLYPAGFLDNSIQGFPNYNAETTYYGNIAPSGATSTGYNTAASNTAVESGFTSGQGLSAINSTLLSQGVPFNPPAINAYFPGKFRVPEYLEYNLQIQRGITQNFAMVINYTGNYGYNEILQDQFINASDNTWDPFSGSWVIGAAGSFAGLDAPPADPSYTRITAYTNSGHSNYNGIWVAGKYDGHGLHAEVSYTFSHALDTISNGGVGENFNAGSIGGQLTPNMSSLNLNYSNADYDIRNNFVGDFVYVEPYKSSNLLLDTVLGGWTIGGKFYARGGIPFSITNAILGNDGYTNLGAAFMPQKAPGVTTLTNTSGSNPHQAVYTSALAITDLVPAGSQTTFGDVRRNALYGPHYFDTDISLLKTLYRHNKINFQIGANAYNIFNHVNFSNPGTAAGNGGYGLITSTVAPPTSPYGSFQGAAVTQRVLQLHGRFEF